MEDPLPPRPSTTRPRGVTLVELLVVIAIIGVLVGMLLPAVQSARESARLTSCRNNAVQLARAVLNCESQHGRLPSGGWGNEWLGIEGRAAGARQPGGWIYGVLPFLELAPLADSVAGATSASCAGVYGRLVATPVAVAACASRRPAVALGLATNVTYRTGCSTALSLPTACRSDYAANGGSCAPCPSTVGLAGRPAGGSASVTICHVPPGNPAAANTLKLPVSAVIDGGHASHPGDHIGACNSCTQATPLTIANPASLVEGDAWGSETLGDVLARSDGGLPDLQDGLVFRMSAVSTASVRDGMSTTYLLGEKYVASDQYATGTDAGDDRPMFVGFSEDTIRWAHDSPTRDQPGVSRARAFGSAHAATWTAAFADGSVQSIVFTIDAAVHRALAGRADMVVVERP
jgi:prepilin-type N-terminal cleavage/methylation domain-containing protein